MTDLCCVLFGDPLTFLVNAYMTLDMTFFLLPVEYYYKNIAAKGAEKEAF